MFLDRTSQILKHASREGFGIEVGPYFNPLVPKRLGYRCLILDVVDAATLRETARRDPWISADAVDNIEEVDIVGSSSDLEALVLESYMPGTFDYVVSSHNFEHLPDPIRFLRGCEKVLKPGGFVSMAVPDRRVCFDYFRPVTSLAEWLDAYHHERRRPSEATVFESASLYGTYHRGEKSEPGFSLADDPANFVPGESLEEAYAAWKARLSDGGLGYHDAHCSVMTPASLHLMLADLQFLGLLNLEIVEISDVNYHEFYVHLRNPVDRIAPLPRDEFYARRALLLRRLVEEQAEGTVTLRRLRVEAGYPAAPSPPGAANIDPRVAGSRGAAFRHWLGLVARKAVPRRSSQ